MVCLLAEILVCLLVCLGLSIRSHQRYFRIQQVLQSITAAP